MPLSIPIRSATLALLAWVAVSAQEPAAASPAFTGSWESLSAGYRTPTWFQDAKFGIFMHWGPCSIPAGANDGWYGRQMYMQSGAPWGKAYHYHLENFGHPTEVGYKEVIAQWKAERWDPVELARFYKSIGARYVVPVAVHHDNYDLWDSKHHPWNSVRVGPKRDIIAAWKKAVEAEGLRFGVSSHSDRAYSWFLTAHGADKTGPKAGQPYDGRLTKADGAGTWWQGLNPQDLYGLPPAQRTKTTEQDFIANWQLRTEELIDRYQPDLIYFDGGLPFGSVGLDLAAKFYNDNRARHGGRLDAVINIKGSAPSGAVTLDIEKGQTDRTLALPWQTDTTLNHHWYADRMPLLMPDATAVLHLMADVVSKNGNLLLNVALEADGTLPEDQRSILRGVGDWLQANGTAIYGTRPTRTFGEGPTKVEGGSFNQRKHPFTPRDIRFTCAGDRLFALVLGTPADGQVLIRSLGAEGPFGGSVQKVSLVAGGGTPTWEVTPEGLRVRLPAGLPASPIIALAIDGLRDLAPDGRIRPDLAGVIDLGAPDATLQGQRLGEGGIGHWHDSSSTVRWTYRTRRAGTFDVVARVAHPEGGGRFTAEIGGARLTADVPATGDWNRWRSVYLGTVALPADQEGSLVLRPEAEGWKALNLSTVRLVPRPAGSPAGWVELAQDSQGLVDLPADRGIITGKSLRVEGGGNLGWWSVPGDAVAWPLRLYRAGTYRIELTYSSDPTCGGSEVELTVGGRRMTFSPAVTSGWGAYVDRTIGTVELPAGDHTLSLKALTVPRAVVNLQQVRLAPVDAPDAAPAMGTAAGPGDVPVCR